MRLAALCAGYGGLEMAASRVLGTRTVWTAEADPHASRVLAYHDPGIPNLGDITTVDWTNVPEVDVVTAGFPCQDISNAGLRAGIGGPRSGIWKNVAEAVRILRPGLVLLENVAVIKRRGLDTVVRDLDSIGYGIRWTYLRASGIGAPHQRNRWFAVAEPGGDSGEVLPPACADSFLLLPTPAARDWKSGASNLHGVNSRPLNEVAVLLPSPTASDGAGGPGRSPRRTGGDNLRTAVTHLLPTPKASDGPHGGPNQRDAAGNLYLPGIAPRLGLEWTCVDERDFGPAVARWEGVTGREAPAPVETGPRGGKRLAPEFVEWMMGLPAGHVTGVPDIPRAQQLKILGNGVVPLQAEAAFRLLLASVQGKKEA